MRMQAGAVARTYMGKIHTALLVSDNHVDITPRPFRLDCLFAFSWIAKDSKPIGELVKESDELDATATQFPSGSRCINGQHG